METVLIVEDTPEIAAMMALTLKSEGYHVLQASEGRRALELAAKHLPELILLDVMMPGMSGFEVAKTLKANELTAPIPIIFVTARHEIDDLVQGLEVAVDYIAKPFAVPELVARVRAAIRTRKLQTQLQQSNDQLSKLAVTDALTELLNRRGFDQQLEDELWRARRFGDAIALVIFDLDHFKRVNDNWGHAQGDIVLHSFAKILTDSSRRVDKVARIGGEEFAILLPATDEAGVRIVCEKIRQNTLEAKISCATCEKEGETISITTSGGGVIIPKLNENGPPTAEFAAGLLALADKCLYEAKQGGRNKIVTIISDGKAVIAAATPVSGSESTRVSPQSV